MADVPLITVLMPLYEHGDSVGSALQSMLKQTVGRLQVVVVDDGSTDGGPEIVAGVAEQDARVTLIRRSHQGIVAALQAGLDRIVTPYVARMDADDWSAPERLARQLELLTSEPSLAAVDCQVALAAGPTTGYGMKRYVSWVNGHGDWNAMRNHLLEESPLVHPASLMRTEALRAVGGYVDGPWPEDYALWLRLVAAGYRLGKVQETLFTWSDPPQRLTRTDGRCTAEAHLALKVAILPRLLPEVRAGVQIWGAGPTGRAWHHRLLEAGIPVLRIFDVKAGLIGTERHGAVVHSVDDLPRHPRPICLIALGQPKAKALTLQFLTEHGLKPWEHYLFVS